MTESVLRVYLMPECSSGAVIFEAPRSGDAGFDLRAAREYVLKPGAQALISTGLKVAIPNGWVGIVKDRSSIALQRIYSHGGVIDSSYRGEIKLILSNHGENAFEVKVGDKIAQLIIVPCLVNTQTVSDEALLGDTERGEGGFGSSGRK